MIMGIIMKKALIVLFVLLTLGTAAYAKQGFTLRGGFGYDYANLRTTESEVPGQDGINFKAHAFGSELGAAYNFSDKFQIYLDSSIGFYDTFTTDGEEFKKTGEERYLFMSNSEHVGAAFCIALSDRMNVQVGGGLACESVQITSYGKTDEDLDLTAEADIISIGVGLYANFDYKFSNRFALAVTVHPDLMLLTVSGNSTTITTVIDNTVKLDSTSYTAVGAGVSFKLNAAVGVKFAF